VYGFGFWGGLKPVVEGQLSQAFPSNFVELLVSLFLNHV